MKTICRSGSLKFSALSLLAAFSLTGNPVIAAEPDSDAQQQARELLSGKSRDVTARSVSAAAAAVSATFGDAQAQARAVLAPNTERGHSLSSDSAATTVPVIQGAGADRLARNQGDAQEAARRVLLGTGQAVLN